jgi:ubiquinol-cytochrome c reductase cytochrome b subunit
MPSALQSSLRAIKQWWRVRLGNVPLPAGEKGVKFPALWVDLMRLAGVFFGVLILTGILLSFNYEPSARPLSQNSVPLAMAHALKTVVVHSDTLCMANEVLLLPMKSPDSVQFPPQEITNIQIMRDEQGQILTATAATASIEHRIMQQIPFGAIIRGIHILSVHCFIGCSMIAFVLLFFRRGYRAPLEIVWLYMLGILFFALFSAFTGHILPWNIRGYVSAQIVISAISYLPFGETLGAVLRGGTALQPATLPRIFILHILISPLIILWLLRSLFRLARKLGDIPTSTRLSYFSKGAIACLLLAFGAIIVIPFGNYFDRLPADLTKAISGAVSLRPSWYFLPEFQMLRIFPNDLAALLLVACCGFWIILPFIGAGSRRKRIIVWIIGTLQFICMFGLGIAGLFR